MRIGRTPGPDACVSGPEEEPDPGARNGVRVGGAPASILVALSMYSFKKMPGFFCFLPQTR